MQTLADLYGIFVPDILPCMEVHPQLMLNTGNCWNPDKCIPLQCELPLEHTELHHARYLRTTTAW